MKRFNNIYEKIYDINNLKLAHKNARRDKLYYAQVKQVDENPEKYLREIQDMIKNKTYKVSKYSTSIIHDKGKDRVLMKLPYFPDRIIQWAIMLQLEPIFMQTFCSHTCASIKRRGIKEAVHLTKKYMDDKENSQYCLKMDVKKFYPSINHVILKQLLRRKFKDKDLLWLLDKIIDSTEGNKGMPIGSYLSQFLANFYLSYFDHWLKEVNHMEYVVRYMDDIVVFHKSKETLHQLKIDIKEYLQNNLDLTLKENWQVFPTRVRGVDFVGFRFFGDYTLLRKRTCKSFKKKMVWIRNFVKNVEDMEYGLWCSFNSYKGWLIPSDSYRLEEKYMKPLNKIMKKYYWQKIKKKGGF